VTEAKQQRNPSIEGLDDFEQPVNRRSEVPPLNLEDPY